MRKKVVIWGASGHARVVADILRLAGEYEIVGFLDDINPGAHGRMLSGSPVLGGREHFSELRKQGVTHLTFGIGDCAARFRLASVAVEAGFDFATAIHPSAVIATDSQIGAGAVVAAGAVVNPGVVIGKNSIINTCASVDHECHLGEVVHIGPGVHMGGCVTIGNAVWIGIGASIFNGVKVGERSIVGAGSLVTKDVQNDVVVYGSPARVVRAVTEHHARLRHRVSSPSNTNVAG